MGWPGRQISTIPRGSGGEVTVDGKAPAVNVDRGPAHENQDVMENV
jgi:hypothetical protein